MVEKLSLDEYINAEQWAALVAGYFWAQLKCGNVAPLLRDSDISALTDAGRQKLEESGLELIGVPNGVLIRLIQETRAYPMQNQLGHEGMAA